ncbi:MAG: molybdopterin dinucleotide binding domain-containing protein, partial [Candidatus Zixiibacteriota bacterium]
MLAERIGQKLFSSVEEMTSGINRLLNLETGNDLPAGFIEVKETAIEADNDYPVALFLVDDPHHSGHLTEKSSSLLNFTSEAYVEISPALAEQLGVEDGGPVRVESQAGKIIVPVRISEHVTTDVALIPRNFSARPVNSLTMRKRRVNRVKLSAVSE